MNADRLNQDGPRIQSAVRELQGLIQARYPQASFDVAPEEDPDGIYLRATVDEDVDDVLDVVMDRLLEFQVEQSLPVYVMPVRPLESVLARLHSPMPKLRPRIEIEAPLSTP